LFLNDDWESVPEVAPMSPEVDGLGGLQGGSGTTMVRAAADGGITIC
jgi:hypothetical protein